MTDNDSISTLSREDALTLECDDTEEEVRIETYIVEPEESEEEDYPDTESGDAEDELPWLTDEEIAAMEEADAQWRNPDAYYYDYPGYDPAGEI